VATSDQGCVLKLGCTNEMSKAFLVLCSGVLEVKVLKPTAALVAAALLTALLVSVMLFF
jgi:hypothetical protein